MHKTLSLISTFLLFVALATSPGAAHATQPLQTPTAPADAAKAGVTFIDADGDGYGVGSPKGPDADDTDPAVNTPATVAAKYPDIRELLRKIGYGGGRIFYIAPNGDDRAGKPNDPAAPYASFDPVVKLLAPDDAALFRAGTYKDDYPLVCKHLTGSADKPILIAAYPGELVTLDSSQTALLADHCRFVTFDGLTIVNSRDGAGKGISMVGCSDVTLRHTDSSGHTWGIIGMQDLHRVTMDSCLLHDNPGEHGVYLGARDLPNSDLAVRKCLIFRNGRHGLQHNGRVKNFLIEGNVIHTNSMGGISLINGTCDSSIRENLIFNNNKQGLIFYTYDDASPAIVAYDQTGNTVEGNVIWVGKYSWNAASTPETFAAVLFNDETKAQSVTMAGNVFRGNVLCSAKGETFKFMQARFAGVTVAQNNLIYRAAGQAGVVSSAGAGIAFTDLAKACKAEGNRFLAPKFKDVSIEYCQHPEKFDFSLPAADKPTTASAPAAAK